MGSVVSRSLVVFTVVKLVGAAYLGYLGVRTYRARGELAEAMNAVVPDGTSWGIYRQGVLVGLTNPKALVFFAAVLPQFVDPAAGGVPVRMAVLGLAYVVVAMALDAVWGLAAGAVRGWMGSSPRRLAGLGGVGGVTMIGLGVGLAVTGRRD